MAGHTQFLPPVIGTPEPRNPSPNPTHLSIPGQTNGHRILRDATSGYVAPKFEGKEEQQEKVMDALETKGFIPPDFIDTETKWFYNDLGIDDMYFRSESVDTIVNHILSLYAGKIAAYARDDKRFEIRLDKESEDHAVYIDTSQPGISVLSGPQYEARIDQKYLDNSYPGSAYRLETFRSPPSTDAKNSSAQQLRCYFVYKCDFVNPKPSPEEQDLKVISDKLFLEKATPNTLALYQGIVSNVVQRTGPVIEMYEVEGTREKRLVIGYRQRSARGLFSAMSDLYHYYGVTSTRKYVEQFSNGVTVMSIYLRPVPLESSKYPPIEASIHQIMKEVSLLYCIPRNDFQAQFVSHTSTLQETIYAHTVAIFGWHFLNRLGMEYTTLQSILDPKNSVHQETISRIKRRLREETFTSEYIIEIINNYPEIVRLCYLAFARVHYVQTRGSEDDFIPTLSYQRLQVDEHYTPEELTTLISKKCTNENERMIMGAFVTFNQHVLKTNFYTPTKVALSFRFNPAFVPTSEYPEPLYGMFLVIGSEFRGFHCRFRDIARGGIRIVKSRNKEAYSINARSLFDENYNLANTQQRKNKDIPEGGSKGVILLNVDTQDKSTGAFHKYIDSIMDLLLHPDSPGIKDPIVDLHGQQEILFMGPDENTAHLMDWAVLHAKQRGAPWWKGFTTGKSPSLGGIPHDAYGMTSLSVREYVEGIYRKLGIDQKNVRKLQTGGPDGDLGSNEILLGHEKYIAISDGSGVLYDPNGLDTEEIRRLAKARTMISGFDMSKLSKQGYRVLVEDKEITLPNGEVVLDGTQFRNSFFLRSEHYDTFVPCGGRPESVNLSNVNQLIVDGKSQIPYIVEGANLFFSQDAKLRLEKAGCILFKDASANKGGVTSSSMEVLASLSFDDAGFEEHMSVKDGKAPAFYTEYVKSVQETIKRNAELEFEAIWREHDETGKPNSILSDELSRAITKLDEELQKSELWDNIKLREGVLNEALPNLLLKQLGLKQILTRVPDNYLRAIFGSYLASRFIYQFGSRPSQFAFFDFMSKKQAQILGSP